MNQFSSRQTPIRPDDVRSKSDTCQFCCRKTGPLFSKKLQKLYFFEHFAFFSTTQIFSKIAKTPKKLQKLHFFRPFSFLSKCPDQPKNAKNTKKVQKTQLFYTNFSTSGACSTPEFAVKRASYGCLPSDFRSVQSCFRRHSGRTYALKVCPQA